MAVKFVDDETVPAAARDGDAVETASETAYPPPAAIAIRLIDAAEKAGAAGLIHIADDERRAEDIGAIVRQIAPAERLETLVFPPWDCLPYDHVSPSRESMGRRMSVLLALAGPARRPRLVVTSPEAVLQRVPPRDALEDCVYTLKVGDAQDLPALQGFVDRMGYMTTERVDEPGDVELRDKVIDIFPAAAPAPFRLNVEDGRVSEIRTFDPVTQRTQADVDHVVLTPASEVLLSPDEGQDDASARAPGVEHALPEVYSELQTLFDYLPESSVSSGERADVRRAMSFAQIQDAYQSRLAFAETTGASSRPPTRIERLYLDDQACDAAIAARRRIDLTKPPVARTPDFALERRPLQALAAFVRAEADEGRRVVLAGVGADLRGLARRLSAQMDQPIALIPDWRAVRAADTPGPLMLDADIAEGFVDAHAGFTLVATAQVLGSRAQAQQGRTTDIAALVGETDLRFADMVIHEDHGVGVLRGLEPVEAAGVAHDAVRLDYHGETTLLTPIEDLAKVWRYGSDEDAVRLDHLNTGAWAKRRAEVEASVVDTAHHLVDMARRRDAAQAPKLVPPRQAYERFASRFPFAETADQASAIRAVLDDLASGRPMDRLVCGDVGFGKTEVALRAAAAAALAGKQVCVIAPTTVLVRQHVQTFQRRFEGTGLEVAHLSRLVQPAEAKRVKAGLASGEIRIVVGTHALAADSVAFADLGLLIIDEEQRFGAKLKTRLRALAPEGHALTLTATPIPRTLQMAMVGVQDISVIATPPARRRPIRTVLTPFDPASVRNALVREKARGGQSFVVVPRIADIAPMQAKLAELAPELSLLVAHGELPVEETDAAMVAFADGRADVLLATNIIESGLDVPRANTMMVWRPDRFGLAQLHQLRGRVGRGRSQGAVYLLEDGEEEISEATRSRLSTLEAFDRLGAGLAISARDLDLRGAGDLVGDDQAGHVKLIGLGLYQTLLERAVRLARGEPVDDALPPELNLELTGRIPEAYVAEAEVRINLYARLSRLTRTDEVKAFEDEVENRFGPPPPELATLFSLARLRILMRRLGAAKVSAGPKAIAITFRGGVTEQIMASLQGRDDLAWRDDRLVISQATEPDAGRMALVEDLLEKMAA